MRAAAAGTFALPAATLGKAVPAITPSCSDDLPEIVEVSAFMLRLPVVLDRIVAGSVGLRFSSTFRTSCGVLPLYIGAISGCTIDAVPSYARASLHDSR